ncbi:MAG: hypothetical protein HQK84_03915, partial [Nitrospinae bacterium]|nr:hypothetical protein [Nitrospinota bacterium]
ISSIGKYGSEDDCFHEPAGITEDEDGRLYVVDKCNHRIAVYNDKKFMYSLGKRKTVQEDIFESVLIFLYSKYTSLFFEFPTDIIYKDGKFSIVDSGNHRVVVIERSGKTLYSVGGLNYPQNIVNLGDSFAVSDMNNSKVTVFTPFLKESFSYNFSQINDEPLYPYNLFTNDGGLIISFSNSPDLYSINIDAAFLTELPNKEILLEKNSATLLNAFCATTGKGEKVTVDALTELLESFEDEGTRNDLQHIISILPSYIQNHEPESSGEAVEMLSTCITKRIEEALMKVKNQLNDFLSFKEEFYPDFEKLLQPMIQQGLEEPDYDERLLALNAKCDREKTNLQNSIFDVINLFALSEDFFQKTFTKNRENVPNLLQNTIRQITMLADLFLLTFHEKNSALQRGKDILRNNQTQSNEMIVNLLQAYYRVLELNEFAGSLSIPFKVHLRILKTIIKERGNIESREHFQALKEKLRELYLVLDFEWSNHWITEGHVFEAMEDFLVYFDQKAEEVSSIKENKDIDDFIKLLTGEETNINIALSSLTHFQAIKTIENGVSSEGLEALENIPSSSVHKILSIIIQFTLDNEKNLQILLEEKEKLIEDIETKSIQSRWYLNSFVKSTLMGREIALMDLTHIALNEEISFATYKHQVSLFYLMLCNYSLFHSLIKEGNHEEAKKIPENIEVLTKNFQQQYDALREELVNTNKRMMGSNIMESNYSELEKTELNDVMKKNKGNRIDFQNQFLLRKLLIHFSRLQSLTSAFDQYFQEKLTADKTKKNDLSSVAFSVLITSKGLQEGEILDPSHIQFVNNELWVCNPQHNNISVFTLEGDYSRIALNLKYQNGSGNITAFDVDKEGNIYVINPFTNVLEIYNGHHQLIARPSDNELKGKLNMPAKITCSPNGNLFIANINNNNILEIDFSGKLLRTITHAGEKPFTTPSNVVFLNNGNIAVPEFTNKTIKLLDSGWNLIKEFSTNDSNVNSFTGGAVDKKGRIWFTNLPRQSLYVFDSELNFLFTYGRKGKNKGEFMNTFYLTSHEGVLYVIDRTNNRIVKLDIID